MTDELTEKVAYAIFRAHDTHGVDFSGRPREVSLKAAQAAIELVDAEEVSARRREGRARPSQGEPPMNNATISPHATIRLAMEDEGRGSIVVDGVDISSIVKAGGVRLDLSGIHPTVTVDLVPSRFEVDGKAEFRIALCDVEREALIAAGWTPPAEARHE